MNTETKSDAEQQAAAQVRSIVEMVAALECDYDRLNDLEGEDELDHDEINEVNELKCAAGGCKDQDEARERIHEDALSVEVRSGWESLFETLEPAEFMILLCTGGPGRPHCRRPRRVHAEPAAHPVPGLVHAVDRVLPRGP